MHDAPQFSEFSIGLADPATTLDLVRQRRQRALASLPATSSNNAEADKLISAVIRQTGMLYDTMLRSNRPIAWRFFEGLVRAIILTKLAEETSGRTNRILLALSNVSTPMSYVQIKRCIDLVASVEWW